MVTRNQIQIAQEFILAQFRQFARMLSRVANGGTNDIHNQASTHPLNDEACRQGQILAELYTLQRTPQRRRSAVAPDREMTSRRAVAA